MMRDFKECHFVFSCVHEDSVSDVWALSLGTPWNFQENITLWTGFGVNFSDIIEVDNEIMI